MTHPRFFGYGSLVNLATHGFTDPRPAILPGWRRVWRHTTLRTAAFLSVEPDPDSAIQGITAQVPHGDWTALDLREAAYTRRDVTARLAASAPTAVYQVSDGHLAASTDTHPILLSYIDVVVQGYLQRFGPTGVAAFFATTRGWNAPIHDDRSAPVYPRAQTLTADETAMVDRALAHLRA